MAEEVEEKHEDVKLVKGKTEKARGGKNKRPSRTYIKEPNRIWSRGEGREYEGYMSRRKVKELSGDEATCADRWETRERERETKRVIRLKMVRIRDGGDEETSM